MTRRVRIGLATETESRARDVRETSLARMDCSIARTLELVGDRWTLMIIRSMFALRGLHRFEEFRAELGIAKNILSDRLDLLVGHGIVDKRMYCAKPPRYEYHLTKAGQDLWPVIIAIMTWGDTYTTGDQGPPVILRHNECEHDTTPVLACGHCHKPISPRTITGRDAPSRSDRTGAE